MTWLDEEENAGFKGWSACAKAMREYGESLVKRWNEEIDTLLVFAGLFSAVLAAFTIESYPLLQQDPQDLSLSVLREISQQLSNINGNGTASSTKLLDLPFRPPGSAVRINVTWVTALVASLVCALLGILVKSWLREFQNRGLTSPRDSVRMRQFRYDGLVTWHVSDIVASLPLLLQFALVLFLVGLLDLLWTVNATVAVWTTVIVSSSLFVVFASFIAPMFRPSCPYKSALTLHVHHTFRFLASFLTFHPQLRIPVFATWWDHDRQAVAIEADHATDNLDDSALEWIHKHLLDDNFLDSVSPCISELTPGTRANFVFWLIADTAETTSWDLIQVLRAAEDSSAHETLQRQLLRAGHRANARMLRLILDVLPDALPDLRPMTVATTTISGRFTLMYGLPGIWVDDSALRTSDMLAALHPLLSTYTMTGRPQEQASNLLVPRIVHDLVSLLHSRRQQPSTLEKVFHLFQRFSYILHLYVTRDNVR